MNQETHPRLNITKKSQNVTKAIQDQYKNKIKYGLFNITKTYPPIFMSETPLKSI